MRKFRIYYFIIIAFILLMIFTKGVKPTAVIYEHSDGANVVFNCIVISLIMIVTLLITIIKKNIIKKKWLYFTIIFLLLFFVPLGINHYSGGIAGKLGNNYIYLWSWLIPILHFKF